MTFTFYSPPSLTPEQSGAMPDIIGQLLRGYTGVTNAKFLKPNLQEALTKAKLYNQWYGPNMQSEIGLRGAQAGHLGSLTTGQNITNQYLPDKLKAEAEAYHLQQQQNEMLNNMLRKRLSGQGNGNNAGQYAGNNNFDQQQQPDINQDNQPNQNIQPYPIPNESSVFPGLNTGPKSQQIAQPAQVGLPYGAPEISADDILNKKVFGMDTFTPKYKAWIDAQTKSMNAKQAAEFKNDAKKDFEEYKEIQAAQHDVPQLKNALQSAIRLKNIIESRPAFFGHTPLPIIGKFYNPAERFANTATDPLAGEFMSLLIPQLAGMEQQLSSRGNIVALKTSASKLPSFENSQQAALGRANGLIDSIIKRIQASQERAGGNIKKIGNKRYKNIGGEWHELEKGEY
jgi:hypothetical protein